MQLHIWLILLAVVAAGATGTTGIAAAAPECSPLWSGLHQEPYFSVVLPSSSKMRLAQQFLVL